MRLIAIGWWTDEAPNELVDPDWRPTERESLVQYVQSGVVAAQSYGYSWCRFRCGASDPDMGTQDLTDGTWVWPEGLYHYLRAHSLRLPDEFARHAADNSFAVSCSMPSETDKVYYDPRLWARWCAGRGLKYCAYVHPSDPLKDEIVEELHQLWKQTWGERPGTSLTD